MIQLIGCTAVFAISATMLLRGQRKMKEALRLIEQAKAREKEALEQIAQQNQEQERVRNIVIGWIMAIQRGEDPGDLEF